MVGDLGIAHPAENKVSILITCGLALACDINPKSVDDFAPDLLDRDDRCAIAALLKSLLDLGAHERIVTNLDRVAISGVVPVLITCRDAASYSSRPRAPSYRTGLSYNPRPVELTRLQPAGADP